VAGTDVVEAYLHFPAAADEPPLGLEAFAAVSLRAGKATTVQLHVMPSAFETWGAHGFTVVGGRYELEVGTSSADLPLTASITAG